MRSIWLGFDAREAHAFAVARHSIHKHLNVPIKVRALIMSDLQRRGLYMRETIRSENTLFDVISQHPMATEFAISRFLVPWLARNHTFRTDRGPRWAIFADCDILLRESIEGLFAEADPKYAVQVVKHDHVPVEGTKMDGQVQSIYVRKNWSSVMLFNVDHPAHDTLTPTMVNTWPGRDMHAFCWLKDHEIGELSPRWNYLVGHNIGGDAALVHFTDGIPTMAGYRDCEFADEWFACLNDWAGPT